LASHHLALPNQRIYLQAHLRSLLAHLSLAEVVARAQMRSEVQARQALLVLALEASDKPSPRNPQQPEQACLGRPLASLNSSSSSSRNNSNSLRGSGDSRSRNSNNSSSPHLGLVSLVRVVVHLGSKISPPLVSGLVVPSVHQV